MNFKTKLGGFMTTLSAAIVGFAYSLLFGPPAARTCDVAITYRMGGGVPGDVNRSHPASILPVLINTTSPPRAYGELCLFDTTNGVRAIIAADQSDSTAVVIAGAAVRSFPTQQASGGMSASLGSATPPVSGVMDLLREGYIICKMKAGVTVKKGDPVWVWAVATSGANILGELQAASSASNTVPISNARFWGPADASGNVEVEVRAG